MIFGMAIPVKQDMTLLDQAEGVIGEDGSFTKSEYYSFLIIASKFTFIAVVERAKLSTKRRGNFPPHVVKRLKQWMMDHLNNPFPTEHEVRNLSFWIENIGNFDAETSFSERVRH